MTFFILKLPQVTPAVLAEDTNEACSSYLMTGGIQDDKENKERRKHQAKRQKQP
jgi:hypothetical protein